MAQLLFSWLFYSRPGLELQLGPVSSSCPACVAWQLQVTEAMLREAVGATTCGEVLAARGVISALFSQVSTHFFIESGGLLKHMLL